MPLSAEVIEQDTALFGMLGWKYRAAWIGGCYEADVRRLSFGEYRESVERNHAQGRCFVYDYILNQTGMPYRSYAAAPAAVEEIDDVAALGQELMVADAPGWRRRVGQATEIFQRITARLTGLDPVPYETSAERQRDEGKCQALAQIMQRDDLVRQEFERLIEEQREQEEEDKSEATG